MIILYKLIINIKFNYMADANLIYQIQDIQKNINQMQRTLDEIRYMEKEIYNRILNIERYNQGK